MSKLKKQEYIYRKISPTKKKHYQDLYYAKSGLLIGEVNYDDKGEFEVEKKYDYEDGLLIKETEVSFNDKVVIQSYKYNENGELIEKVKSYEDGSTERVIKKMKTGKEIIEEYDWEGELVGRKISYLNEKGNIYRYEECQGEEVYFCNWLEYSSNGLLMKKEVEYRVNQEWNIREEYKYDINGREIEIRVYNNEGEFICIEEKEYELGELVRTNYKDQFDPHKDCTIDYQYDMRGLILEIVKRDYRGDIVYLEKLEYNDLNDVVYKMVVDLSSADNNRKEYLHEIEYY